MSRAVRSIAANGHRTRQPIPRPAAPPYHTRLMQRTVYIATSGSHGDVHPFLAIGRRLKERFAGWTLALLAADRGLAGELRLRAARRNALWNGGLRCELLQYPIGGEVPGR